MKRKIFCIALRAVIATIVTVGVYAINASEITYNDTTLDVTLNDLYNKANRTITLTNPTYSETLTTVSSTSRQQTIELTKGNWIVTFARVTTWGRASTSESTGTSNYTLVCNNGGTATKVASKSYQKSGTDPLSANSSTYYTGRLHENMYLINITSDTDTCYVTYVDASENSSIAEMATIQAVKINYE